MLEGICLTPGDCAALWAFSGFGEGVLGSSGEGLADAVGELPCRKGSIFTLSAPIGESWDECGRCCHRSGTGIEGVRLPSNMSCGIISRSFSPQIGSISMDLEVVDYHAALA